MFLNSTSEHLTTLLKSIAQNIAAKNLLMMEPTNHRSWIISHGQTLTELNIKDQIKLNKD